jgi:hypothetical protein
VLQVHSASHYAVKVLAVKGKKCLVEWAYDEEDKKSIPGEVTENFVTRSMSKWDTLHEMGKSLASHPHTLHTAHPFIVRWTLTAAGR